MFKRISTSRVPPRNAIDIELTNGKTISLTHAQVALVSTPAAMISAIKLALAESGLDLYVHKNLDSSWSIATGSSPDTWPEDEAGPLDV